jgi:hypothetical protein
MVYKIIIQKDYLFPERETGNISWKLMLVSYWKTVLLPICIYNAANSRLNFIKNETISISPSSTFLTYVAIFQFHQHMVFISCRCFGMREIVWHMISFFYSRYSTDKQGFLVSFTGSFPQIVRSLQRSRLPIQPSFRPNAVWCVSYGSLSLSLYTDLDYGSCHLPELELELKAGVTGWQWMSTPPRPVIPPPVYSEVCVCPILKFVFPIRLMRLMTVRYLCYFL